ncbi:MAG TPA: S8 family serine peptidase [Polyangiaceae bacterium]|nr:S8 family serine peptidase [Polyangiaceae bacterium]
MRALVTVTTALLGLLPAARVNAQVDLTRALELFDGREPPRALGERVGLLTQQALPGAVRTGDHWFALDVRRDELPALVAQASGPLWWSPPRRLLMDRADGWVHASNFRSSTGLTGRGVVVGIIDSGLDLEHPDFQTADGQTRVRWLLDFSRREKGLQPELEAELDCLEDPEDPEKSTCAVFSADDIDALLANDTTNDEPRDPFGHGTHVTSLAAGNGLSNDPPRYVGVAPEATLIIARVARSEGGGGILDSDVLKAVSFVFERAEELGMPAVVNLSLGSDFGAHDGSSAFEQGLSSLVGSDHPGRALVVAGGNSAGLFGVDLGLPSPLGIHTEVHVPRGGEARVPIFTPPTDGDVTRGTVELWITQQQGDVLNVGLDDGDEQWIEPLLPGRSGSLDEKDVEITIVNQTSSTLRSAVVTIEGSWPATQQFALRLTGNGSAAIWVQSDGGLSPLLSPGALLPRAFKEGTVGIPGSAPDLIAVGATLNRTEWTDYEGNLVSFPEHGSLQTAPDDTPAYFSGAGPNSRGVLKPDLIAPGANVIGAMSSFADPRTLSQPGLFTGLVCPPDVAAECFVVDDYHAVSGGTSMAAPLVSGAIALLFERDPTLDQYQARALLQAGARQPEGVVLVEQQVGAGVLDLEGTLLAQIAENSPADRVPGSASVLALAASFARPDPTLPLWVLAELRDDDGAPADGFDPRRLALEVRGGAVAVPLTRQAPGLYQFAVAAPAGSGGGELEVSLLFDDAPIATRTIPIAVDHAVAEHGVSARGGCSVSHSRSNAFALLALGAFLTAWRSRRWRSAARTAPRRDRRGAPA